MRECLCVSVSVSVPVCMNVYEAPAGAFPHRLLRGSVYFPSIAEFLKGYPILRLTDCAAMGQGGTHTLIHTHT